MRNVPPASERKHGDAISHSEGSEPRTRHYWRRSDEDVRRWAEQFQCGTAIVRIAEGSNVAPSTISDELHKLGLTITRGHHKVEQPPLRYSRQFVELIDRGPDAVLEFIRDRVWGIQASPSGEKQLRSFCQFVKMHHQEMGVKEIARILSCHRSTVTEWREGTDQPYLIRTVNETLPVVPARRWKLLAMHLTSGGNEPSGWIEVPQILQSYTEILHVLHQIHPLECTYERVSLFKLSREQITEMRSDLFAYLLGMMLGDAGKLGGPQSRYASMTLDLQLTKKKPTNERLGEFTSMCAHSIGINMERIQDKQPTGQTALRHPKAAYRWTSERSPLLAWMFSACLGLRWGETTTTHRVRMDWIFGTPESFRKRFVQGVADSDGCVKGYMVEVASVPNAEFLARILRSLGVTSAHVGYEGSAPLKTLASCRQASKLPLFSEFARTYRYRRLMNYLPS